MRSSIGKEQEQNFKVLIKEALNCQYVYLYRVYGHPNLTPAVRRRTRALGMMLEWHKNNRRANKLKVPSVPAFRRQQQNKERTEWDEKINSRL